LTHWDFNLAATRYGSFTSRNSSSAARDQTYAAKWVLDTSINYRPNDSWTLTLGADNLLDEYPDETSNLLNSTYGMLPYSNYSPFGFNGAYVYGRIRYTW
jgi:iron complex outermembrane receptor protein